jgi:hypothetical protein
MTLKLHTKIADFYFGSVNWYQRMGFGRLHWQMHIRGD